MIVSLRWLSEFLPHFNLKTTEEIAQKLTMGGLEVESISSLGEGLYGVVIGEVLLKRKHPNADKLSICEVNIGKEKLSIVCGAANVREGIKVAVATIGTRLPNGITMKSSKIRGELSEGMILSESELGLTGTSTGIMELPNELAVGRSLTDALDLKDTLIEIAPTPNRGDCLSYLGIAREVAALCRKEGAKLVPPTISLHEISQPASQFIRVEIDDLEACPRYSARIVRNLKIAPSPFWLRQRLERNGVRPINNVVDITNYVMLEMGQPLHAFDLKKIRGGVIRVRLSKDGENISTLDGKDRKLNKGDILICDGDRPLALGGVMGGEDSEVSSATTEVLIESAYFNPTKIRLTSRRLNLISESSYRFERGIDPENVIKALHRAAHLMQDICGGEVLNGALDSYPKPLKKCVIGFRPEMAKRILGSEITPKESGEILSSLGFHIKSATQDILQVEVPSWRLNDITRDIDLIEEIARIRGYETIAPTLPGGRFVENILPPEDSLLRLKNNLTDSLVRLGWREAINLSFVSPQLLKSFYDKDNIASLLNPLGEEFSALRPTLIPSLLQTLRKNISQQNKNLMLFELRTVFSAQGRTVDEKYNLTAVATGERNPIFWGEKASEITYYDLKGDLDALIKSIKRSVEFKSTKDGLTYLHPLNQQNIFISNHCLGWVGEIHPDYLERFEIENRVFAFNLDVTKLLDLRVENNRYKTISKYPTVSRDIAVLMSRDVEVGRVLELITKNKPGILNNFILFDVYLGEHIPRDKKSAAINLHFGTEERTLTDDEVDQSLIELINAIQKDGTFKIRE